MIYFITAKWYVVIFIAWVLFCPAIIFFPILIFEKIAFLYWVLLLGNVFLLVFTWRYNSSPRLSFLRGLEIITGTFMSGCANLTMLYLIPALLMAYGTAVTNMIIGLSKGKSYTQQKWFQVVREYEIVRGRR